MGGLYWSGGAFLWDSKALSLYPYLSYFTRIEFVLSMVAQA